MGVNEKNRTIQLIFMFVLQAVDSQIESKLLFLQLISLLILFFFILIRRHIWQEEKKPIIGSQQDRFLSVKIVCEKRADYGGRFRLQPILFTDSSRTTKFNQLSRVQRKKFLLIVALNVINKSLSCSQKQMRSVLIILTVSISGLQTRLYFAQSHLQSQTSQQASVAKYREKRRRLYRLSFILFAERA